MPLPVEVETEQHQGTESKQARIEAHAVIGEKGRLVIPLHIRQAMGFEAGDEVEMYVQDHEVHFSTRWNRLQRAQERAQRFFALGRSLAEELIAERRADAQSE
jgi:AbrB family looped-hinge helix DNA binding protein